MMTLDDGGSGSCLGGMPCVALGEAGKRFDGTWQPTSYSLRPVLLGDRHV